MQLLMEERHMLPAGTRSTVRFDRRTNALRLRHARYCFRAMPLEDLAMSRSFTHKPARFTTSANSVESLGKSAAALMASAPAKIDLLAVRFAALMMARACGHEYSRIPGEGVIAEVRRGHHPRKGRVHARGSGADRA